MAVVDLKLVFSKLPGGYSHFVPNCPSSIVIFVSILVLTGPAVDKVPEGMIDLQNFEFLF